MQQLLVQLRNPALKVGDGRANVRRPCKWPAILHRSAQNLSCVVEDISVGGCRVRVSSTRVGIGEAVTVEIPSQQMVLDGIIVWKRHGEAGIQFGYSEASHLMR